MGRRRRLGELLQGKVELEVIDGEVSWHQWATAARAEDRGGEFIGGRDGAAGRTNGMGVSLI
jgi:hypothetical protein